MLKNNSAITKHWNEVLRLNQDEVRSKRLTGVIEIDATIQNITAIALL